SKAVTAWDRIGDGQRAAMPHVKIAARVFAFRVSAVRREAQSRAEIPVRADIVERMRVGVSGNESEVVIIAAGEGGLQAVVIRFVVVAHLVDVLQERECEVKRSS